MLAVGLVHGTAASVTTRVKWRLNSKRRSVIFGLSRLILIQLYSVFIGTRTGRFHQRGKEFMHGVINSNKLFMFVCKGKSPRRPRVSDDTVEAVRRYYMRSTSKSTKRASSELDIPQPTVWKIVGKFTTDEALQNPVAPSSERRWQEETCRILFWFPG
jgi:predicted site-specific integrase-resolvase